jgi:hypothetical protein
MRTLLTIVLCVGLPAALARADDLTATTNVVPLPWPAYSPSRLTVETHQEIFDEVPIKFLVFAGSGIRLRTSASGEWICQPEPPPRFSLVLRNFHNPDATLALAIYPRAQFLRDLSPPNWQRYVAGIRARLGPTLVSLQEASDQTYFLGRHNREVLYIEQAAADQPARLHREIFTLTDDRVIVAVVEADAEAQSALQRATDQFLARLNLEE